MYKTDHIFIPFDAEGKAFTGSGKIRVFQSIDNAVKVGFFEDCLVEYEPVVHARWIETVRESWAGSEVCTNVTYYMCSRCQTLHSRTPLRCSNCGAKMENLV